MTLTGAFGFLQSMGKPGTSKSKRGALVSTLFLTLCGASLTACGGTPSWEKTLPGFGAPVHSLVRDPETPSVIYAACGWMPLHESGAFGGVLRSADGGARWVAANRGIPPNTEVLTLVTVPASFLPATRSPSMPPEHGPRASTALLAGTHKAGLFFSKDGFSWQPLSQESDSVDWDRLTIQTIAVHPGPPAIVALGTKERGVLTSDDRGKFWRGLPLSNFPDRNIHSLVFRSHQILVAATWTRGIYESQLRGWTPLGTRFENTRISAVAVDEADVLWIGLPLGGLWSHSPGSDTSHQEGGHALAEAEILSISTNHGTVAVGTAGGDVFVRRRGGRFTALKGLEEVKIFAVSPEPERPQTMILGTSRGFYRILSTKPDVLLVAFALSAVAGLAGIGLFAGWRRTVHGSAHALFHQIFRLPIEEIPGFLSTQMASLSPQNGKAVLERLALFLDRSRGNPRSCFAQIVASTATLFELLTEAERELDAETRRALAETLDHRVGALSTLAEEARQDRRLAAVEPITRTVAARDRLFGSLLRAESPGHIAALETQLRVLEECRHEPLRILPDGRDSTRDALEGLSPAERESVLQELAELVDVAGVQVSREHLEMPVAKPVARLFLHAEFLDDLRDILNTLDQLSRLPSAEDRALFLAKAMTKTIAAQQRLSRHYSAEPTFGSLIATAVLESIRQLLATSLHDIHQRAELLLELRSKVLATKREALVVLEICNTGQGHAQNIVVELQPGDEFHSVQRRQEIKSLLRNQSARAEFAVEPRVSDRVRLTFRISYDDLAHQNHQREFASVVEFRRVAARQTFRPLRPNPYVVGRPLRETDVFVGREKLFTRLETSLEGANQDNIIMLIGPRRMGKTSILRRLHVRLSDRYTPVLVDLQQVISNEPCGFFYDLAAMIFDGLAELDIQVTEPKYAQFEDDPGDTFRRKFLRTIQGALGNRKLLLLFDELEALESRMRKGDLEQRIVHYFRSLIQHEKDVSFILTGTPRLEELNRTSWGVLFNLAMYLRIGHLSEEESSDLLVSPTKSAFEIDPLALDKAYQFTGGHPHFGQILAHQLVVFRNERQLSYLTIQDVNHVAGQVVDEIGRIHLDYLWEEADRDQKLLMLSLKELLQRRGLATLESAERFLQERRIAVGDLIAALHKLIRGEILVDNAGLLSFKMDLLKLWLDRHKGLELSSLSKVD